MIAENRNLPVSKENEEAFLALCSELKCRAVKNIWTPLFRGTGKEEKLSDSETNLHELYAMEISDEEAQDEIRAEDAMELSQGDATTVETTSRELSSNAALCSYISEENLTKLKEALAGEKDDINLEVLQVLPCTLVKAFCEEINAQQISESAVASMLNILVNMEPPFSVRTAGALVQNILFPKVMDMKRPRILTGAVVKFSEKYITAVVEELFIPCLQKEDLGSLQMDVLVCIIKSPVHAASAFFCVREKFEDIVPSENAFPVLLCLIEKKDFLDEHFCNILIKKLKEWSFSYSASGNFTKLVTNVISIWGKKASEAQLAVFKEIVDSNQTRFKRAAVNVLNKLNK